VLELNVLDIIIMIIATLIVGFSILMLEYGGQKVPEIMSLFHMSITMMTWVILGRVVREVR
jgi:hypothetical protein